MNLKKVHHIAIIGSNYEQSKHFYVDLLGFSIIRENYRPERDDSTRWDRIRTFYH